MVKTYSFKRYVWFTLNMSCAMLLVLLGSIIFTGIMGIALMMLGWPNDWSFIVPVMFFGSLLSGGFAAYFFCSDDAFL